MRLPVRLRLKESRDFARVRETGQSHQGRCLVLGVTRTEDLTGFRFGLITSRRLGKAVVRTRVRRLLREIIREQQSTIADGVDVVIIARWRAAEATLNDLRSDWLRVARRAGILRA